MSRHRRARAQGPSSAVAWSRARSPGSSSPWTTTACASAQGSASAGASCPRIHPNSRPGPSAQAALPPSGRRAEPIKRSCIFLTEQASYRGRGRGSRAENSHFSLPAWLTPSRVTDRGVTRRSRRAPRWTHPPSERSPKDGVALTEVAVDRDGAAVAARCAVVRRTADGRVSECTCWAAPTLLGRAHRRGTRDFEAFVDIRRGTTSACDLLKALA